MPDVLRAKEQVVAQWQELVRTKLSAEGIETIMARPEVEELATMPIALVARAGHVAKSRRPKGNLLFSDWIAVAKELSETTSSPPRNEYPKKEDQKKNHRPEHPWRFSAAPYVGPERHGERSAKQQEQVRRARADRDMDLARRDAANKELARKKAAEDAAERERLRLADQSDRAKKAQKERREAKPKSQPPGTQPWESGGGYYG